MAQDPDADLGAELARRIRSHLPTTRTMEEKRMFGGLAFMVDGHMCCGVLGDRLVLRLGSEGVDPGLERPHTAPMDFTGRVSRTMIYVDPPGWEADESLSRWIEEALAFVATLPKR